MSDPKAEYKNFVSAAAMSLAPDEYWCIDHDEGALDQTASKDVTYPIRLFCDAMGCDWDEARESGFRLGKIIIPRAA